MTDKHLHIVSFNVPWPADYGGVIDVFCKIKMFYELGVKVHLHCYMYGRSEASELEKYCEEVRYYKRDMSPRHLLSKLPYIVATRKNEELKQELLKDNHPVVLEGLHCCWLLEELRKISPNRKIYVRTHNVEHHYYAGLQHVERKLWKRWYFYSESRKLDRYENVLDKATLLLSITEKDKQYFETKGYKVALLQTPWNNGIVEGKEGRGAYWLYHGNLSVSENEDAVVYLLNEIATKTSWPFVIAGKAPSYKLQELAKATENVRLVTNPSDEEMATLIADANVIVMVTRQSTGLKLKLLHSLYDGRFCLVNSKMIEGTGLDNLCEIGDSSDDLICKLDKLMQTDFTSKDKQTRQQQLNTIFSNTTIVDFVNRL